MNKIILTFIAVLLCTGDISAQINEGETIMGASIGVNASPGEPSVGFNVENQVTSLGNAATLGLGGILRYSAFRDGPPYYYYDYSYLTLGAQTNVNFNTIGSGKFVPFVGVVLGYNFINSKYVSRDGVVYPVNSRSSGMWLWGQAGFRYFFSSKFAGGIRLGSGNFNFSVLELSFDFKL